MKQNIKSGICLILMVGVLLAGLSGCGKPEQTAEKHATVAFITADSVLEDGSYHQGIWSGIQTFCKGGDLAAVHYSAEQFQAEHASGQKTRAEDADKAMREDAMKQAIDDGAELLVCAGAEFSYPVYQLQTAYPEVSFVLIDAEPCSKEGTVSIGNRTRCAFFAEEEAGYMAGYAVVREGETKLGFMGGKDDPAVRRFGYGFVQGAEAAAKELQLKEDQVSVRYTYTGTYAVDPAVLTQAAKWYQSGVTCIFACGGDMGKSVIHAAEAANGKIVGVDVDQSGLSKTVVTSAKKNLQAYMQQILKKYTDHLFVGGTADRLSARENYVSLELKNSRLQTYKEADHQRLLERMKEADFSILTDSDLKDIEELSLDCVDLEVEDQKVDLLGEASSDSDDDDSDQDDEQD